MNVIRVYKIADRLFQRVIFAAADKAKYVYDPEHKQNPGAQYHKTDKGWYLNKEKGKEENESIKQKPQPVVITQAEQAYINNYKQQDGKFNAFGYIYGLGGFSSARKAAQEKYPVEGSTIQYKIHDFSGGGFGKAPNAKYLANLAAWHFNLGKGDYRTKGVLGEKPSDEQLKEYAQYLKREQEIVKRAGLVTKDGKVRLFRNVGHSLFEYHTDGITFSNYTEHYGAKMQYRGSHIQSWTFRPDLTWNGAKIYAEVPLEAVVASFIGRNSVDTFSHMSEKECMICSSLVHQVHLVGESSYCLKDFKDKYFQEIAIANGASQQEMKEFEKLSKSKKLEDKMKLLKNSLFTPEALNQMAQQEKNPKLLLEIAGSPLANDQTFNILIGKGNTAALEKILQKAQTSKDLELLQRLKQCGNKVIRAKASAAAVPIIQSITDVMSIDSYKNYVQNSSNVNPDVLDAMFEKKKDIGSDITKSKYVYQTVKSPKINPKTLEKIFTTFYKPDMDKENVAKIIGKAVENKNTTTEMIDKFIASDASKEISLPSECIIKMTKFENLSSKSLAWLMKQCQAKDIFPNSTCFRSKNINMDVIDFVLKKKMTGAAFGDLMKNQNLTDKMLEKLAHAEHNNIYSAKAILEHPSCTLRVCETLKENNANDKKVVDECNKVIKEKYNQVSEQISDEEPRPQDIQKMKQLFPESCKGKTMEQLIILFKTLMKRGYWDKAVSTSDILDTQEEVQENDDEEINDEEDAEINDYLNKMLQD